MACQTLVASQNAACNALNGVRVQTAANELLLACAGFCKVALAEAVLTMPNLENILMQTGAINPHPDALTRKND